MTREGDEGRGIHLQPTSRTRRELPGREGKRRLLFFVLLRSKERSKHLVKGQPVSVWCGPGSQSGFPVQSRASPGPVSSSSVPSFVFMIATAARMMMRSGHRDSSFSSTSSSSSSSYAYPVYVSTSTSSILHALLYTPQYRAVQYSTYYFVYTRMHTRTHRRTHARTACQKLYHGDMHASKRASFLAAPRYPSSSSSLSRSGLRA